MKFEKPDRRTINLYVSFSELVEENYVSIKCLTEEIGLDILTINNLLEKAIIPDDYFFIRIENYFNLKLFPIIDNPNLPIGENKGLA
jgi:hypothetical protein